MSSSMFKRAPWATPERYLAGSPLLLNANNVGAPFPATSTSLEFFGNMPVVRKHFTLVIMAIIVISILPGVIDYLRHRYSKSEK